MNRNPEVAAASRDSHMALRRVERQQVLIERLHACRVATPIAFDVPEIAALMSTRCAVSPPMSGRRAGPAR